MNLNVFVSPNCFCYCKGCYSYSREEKCNQFVPTNVLIDFLEFMHRNGLKKVTLCGGDPLTRSDIIQLLEKLKKIGYAISLDTVGSSLLGNIERNNKILYNQVDAGRLAKLVDVIGIPIDASKSSIMNKFRCGPIDFVDKQKSICELLNKNKGKICINTVVYKDNLKEAEELSKMVSELSFIKKWQIFQFIPLGKMGALNKEQFEITDQQFELFCREILKSYTDDPHKILFKSKAFREKKYILVDNSGNVWVPSDNYRNIIGNINNKSDWAKLLKFWSRSKNL